MSDMPTEVIGQVTSSSNFLMIVFGAVIWILGSFIPFIGFFFTIAGFGLTTIATVQAAMTKPVTSAFPGLLLGGLVQVIGYLILFIPIAGIFIFPFLNISGAVLILFYGSSLALQRAEIPIVKDIEDFIDSRKKKGVEKESKEKAVDIKEDSGQESDTTEQ
ncbi:MAG: hypothetical protein AM325_015930 [Candidatus Thorarchaeota archaeon SMTZ1-45]